MRGRDSEKFTPASERRLANREEEAPEIDVETPGESPALENEVERAETDAAIEKTRERIGTHRKQKRKNAVRDEYVYGDFTDQADEKGKISLTAEQNAALEPFIEKIKTEDSFSPPSLLIGGKTATEYKSRARNFSTRTRILTLPDGRRVFVVHNYPMSGIHRELDALGKWTAGAPMRKAKSKDWKKQYESKSNVATIENDDPDIILVPYIDNVNANDLLAFNHEIDDFGIMPEVKDFGLEEKMDLADSIVDEIAKTHAKGVAWGEAIVANMIIGKDHKPIIVDPEVSYNKGVPLAEQKARDLLDFLQSLVSALRRSEKNIDIESIVQRIMNRYPDAGVKSEIPAIIKDKSRWIRKLLRPIHELPRLGQNNKDYNAVLDALREK
jgi:tRNA A-37 threonylcarbamoyl transferase component Bud32